MRTGSRRTVRRTLGVLLTVVVLAGLGGAAWAAWSAKVTVTAGVSSGTWTTSPTPTPSNSPESTTTPNASTGIITVGNTTTTMSDVTWTDFSGNALTPGTSASNPGRQTCALVQVRGTGATASPWRLDVDISGAPFYGENPGFVYDGAWALSQSDSSTVTLTGTSSLTSAQSVQVRLCNYWIHTSVPSTTTGTWTATTSDPQWNADSSRVCQTVTIAGTATDLNTTPFYYGWDTTLDLGPAAELYLQRTGRQPDTTVFSPDPQYGYAYAIDGDSSGSGSWRNSFASTVRLSNGKTTALLGTGSTSVTACVFNNH